MRRNNRTSARERACATWRWPSMASNCMVPMVSKLFMSNVPFTSAVSGENRDQDAPSGLLLHCSMGFEERVRKPFGAGLV